MWKSYHHNGPKLLFQDVGGQDKIRPLWRHYFAGTQGLIFVVDCADHDRIDEARQELHRIINDREMKETLILVFANKQDISGGECRQVSDWVDCPSIMHLSIHPSAFPLIIHPCIHPWIISLDTVFLCGTCVNTGPKPTTKNNSFVEQKQKDYFCLFVWYCPSPLILFTGHTHRTPTMYWPHAHCIPTVYRPHTHRIPTTSQPYTNHVCTCWPQTHRILTTSRRHTNHILTTYPSHTNHILYQPGTSQRMTTYMYPPHTDHIPTTYPPHTDHIHILTRPNLNWPNLFNITFYCAIYTNKEATVTNYNQSTSVYSSIEASWHSRKTWSNTAPGQELVRTAIVCDNWWWPLRRTKMA